MTLGPIQNPEFVRGLVKIGPLWIGFLVMLGMLLGVINSPLTGMNEAVSSMKSEHLRQTELLRELCRQGATLSKSMESMRECNR